MGRAHGEARTIQANDFRWRSDRFSLQEELITNNPEGYFGSDAHRSLLESIVVAQTGKSIRVIMSPGQGSKTNMRDKIWVDTAAPGEGSSIEDRMICTKGLLRHECLHITVTNVLEAEEFHRELDEVARKYGEDKSKEIH